MYVRVLIACAFVGVLLAIVVFAPTNGATLWLRTLHDFAHVPIFAAIALAVLLATRNVPAFAMRPRWHRYALAFGVAVSLGALTELAQVPSGRDASWGDLWSDLLGALAAIALYAAFEFRRFSHRATAVTTCLLALLIASAPLFRTAMAYSRRAEGFPAIADFTRGIGAQFISRRFTTIGVEPLPIEWASDPTGALRIDFFPGSWPGIDFTEPPPDWRGYRALAVDVINPTDVELVFTIRIDDREHNGRHADRYNRAFNVAPQTRTTFTIPLADIESSPRDRKFDLSQVKRIILFREEESTAARMYLVNMWLER